MFDEAILGFKRLVEMDPKDTKSFLHLGNIYHEKGQLEEAKNYLKSGIAINPEAPWFHNNLGAVYLKMNMYDEAQQEIEKALSIERSIPLINAHFNMGLLHEARGEIDLAISEYKKEQEVSPFSGEADFNLGLLYANLKDLNNAIKEFQRCIEKNDKFANAYIFLAKAYMDSGRGLDEAARFAKNGLSLNPDLKSTILGHFILADIYNRLGRYQESQQHVTQARELQKSLSHKE
jgi:tetratricopeptide (TPR) repeat protein